MSPNPATSIKPRPVLEEMPLHVKIQIAELLPLFPDRLALWKVSKDFRKVVDSSRGKINIMWRIMHRRIGVMRTDEVCMEYCSHEKGCVRRVLRNEQVVGEMFLEGQNYIDLATRHFESFVSRPKLSYERFHLRILYPQDAPQLYGEFENEKNGILERFRGVLDVLNHRLKVNLFYISYNGRQEDVLSVLPYLESEPLTFFEFGGQSLSPDIPVQFDRIVELEQWKSAPKIRITDLPAESVPVEQLVKFKVFSVEITSMDYLKALLKEVHSSKTLIFGAIKTKSDVETLKEVVGECQWQPSGTGIEQARMPFPDRPPAVFHAQLFGSLFSFVMNPDGIDLFPGGNFFLAP